MDPVEAFVDNIIEATTNKLNIDENDEVKTEHNTTDDNTTEDNTTEDNTTSEIDSQNVEAFNIALHQYLKIDEEIKALLEAIKLRNKTKKNLAESLSTYLRSHEISNVKLGGSYKGKRLESKVVYSSKGFSKENVTKILCNELKEETEIFEKIMESFGRTNVITEKWNLNITNDKQAVAKTKIEKAKTKIDLAEELLNDNS